jgi:hypothetical protein
MAARASNSGVTKNGQRALPVVPLPPSRAAAFLPEGTEQDVPVLPALHA